MNKQDYNTKAENLLDDQTTYSKLKKDPTREFKQKLVAILSRLEQQKVITTQQRLHLYPTSEDPPKFYGLPKVHKKDMPLRPIVSCRGSIFYNVAKFVADIISPLAGKSPYHLKNSLHLKQQLENVKLEIMQL